MQESMTVAMMITVSQLIMSVMDILTVTMVQMSQTASTMDTRRNKSLRKVRKLSSARVCRNMRDRTRQPATIIVDGASMTVVMMTFVSLTGMSVMVGWTVYMGRMKLTANVEITDWTGT